MIPLADTDGTPGENNVPDAHHIPLSRVVPVLPDPEIQNSEGTRRLKVSGRRLQLVRCAYLLS